MNHRISGKEATYTAMEAAQRGPIRVEPLPDDDGQRAIGSQGAIPPSVPAVSDDLVVNGNRPKAPPRVLKPSPRHDRCLAPTPDLEAHRKCLREAFGNTLSDEFTDVIMGKLVEALRPNAYDQLEESTLNAGLHRRGDGRGALQEPGSSRAAGLDGVRLHDLRHTYASFAAGRRRVAADDRQAAPAPGAGDDATHLARAVNDELPPRRWSRRSRRAPRRKRQLPILPGTMKTPAERAIETMIGR
jgi:hypothetical protein